MAGTICLRMVLTLLVSMVLLGTATFAEDVRDKHNETGQHGDGVMLVVITPESHSTEIGDEIHLKGTIDKSLINGAPSDAIILISAPDGSLADTFVLSSPDQHGGFSYALPADVGGDWGFEALYNGVYSPKAEVDVIPSAKSGKTTLTLSGWPVYPRVGDEVTFKGRLTDSSGKGIPDRKLHYQFVSSDSGCVAECHSSDALNWLQAGVEETDLAGEYSFRLPVVEEGGVYVRVLFDGDEQYIPIMSKVIGITAKNS
ncbi:MAG: hypothetical protein LUQ50_06070 [Methanospirillum sp.]|uniref:hypothetical protein n=1 Tax=Methanospirillum sp. TaxID=45200 RepID=UPI0023693389|nr:hypothetical protein [Methanospirillum sp.]MDD1728619.1 hypothetical protein [Methanospirillum sp.]